MVYKGYKQTEEHKRKVRENNPFYKGEMCGEKHPNFGKHLPCSEKAKKKIGNANRKFTKNQEKEICNEYFSEEKPNTCDLAEKWGCNIVTIRNIVKRNGYKLRTHIGHKAWNRDIKTGPLSEKHKRKISKSSKNKPKSEKTKIRISKSLKGKYIGEKNHLFGTHRSEKTKKKISKANKIFTKFQEQQICNEYFSEEKPSTYTLAKKWSCTPTTIAYILKGYGYRLRNSSESHRNKKQSEETKRKRREKTLQQIKNNPGPFKDTKPELKMKEILTSLNIPFEHQFRLGNHLYDFRILNTSVLIEVYGDYYHGNTKKFPKLSNFQLGQKQKDIRNEKLAKENNFVLLKFWEDDILNNTEEVKSIISKNIILI